jgi:S1-C subfamily serine protease
MFVPTDHLKPILQDLIAQGRPNAPSHPWLGLNAEESLGRVFVARVSSDGPAERDGLNSGDIILAVNDQPVQGLADFYRKVWALGSAGVEVPLRVLQGVEIRDITIQSGDRYQVYRLLPQE